jgi:hypothetical protein
VVRRGGHLEVKRRFERIHFEHPIEGFLNSLPVRVLDLAIGGARVITAFRVVPGATEQQLRIDWEGKSIRLNCVTTRCTLLTFAKGGEKSTYDVGLRIIETLDDSDQIMRELIHSYVMKALDEQRANWEGIPPLGPYVHLEGKSDHYRRCELKKGVWKVIATTRPEQPMDGFTVSAEVPPHYIDLLCETYEMTDDEGRRLTRLLAELSVSKAEGVPTRRYLP